MEVEILEKQIGKPAATTDAEEFYLSVFPVVARLVSRWNGTFDDAKDVFHDALVLLMEKERESRFEINTTREAYIVGVCKHLWIKKHNRAASFVKLDDTEMLIKIPNDFYPTISIERLLSFLERTSKRCLDLLHAFYFRSTSLKEVARQQGFTSEHSASVQKYKCLERVRDQVKQKSMTYEDFFE